MTKSKEGIEDAKSWCSRPSAWEHVILGNATTYADVNQPWAFESADYNKNVKK